ncbi:DUF3168 domain-containing protein [Dysgonomonas sp. Marseille-P4677]|uniref:DUF3168 domain-containing protein n=1 Tax=Dysgonomonas sp. Marseille-P4677 TaxID=2364790 RepID=UPI001913D898|nr:DUF3168 domain-containing protein [Dysgonomonas sp. Marseille-P4677]MBK5721374.1 DUF3168 domain-containing protein [Dysgonomonas sp. Marseille-P4677]
MGLADNKIKVTTLVRQIMLDDDITTSYVGKKIFPVVAPKDTIGDFILYQRDGYSKERTKMGVALQKPLVYINVWSNDYDRSQEIASHLNELLDDDFIDDSDPNSIIKIRLIDSSEDYEDNKYIQVLLFEIL